jgi:hypothetical protein
MATNRMVGWKRRCWNKNEKMGIANAVTQGHTPDTLVTVRCDVVAVDGFDNQSTRPQMLPSYIKCVKLVD